MKTPWYLLATIFAAFSPAAANDQGLLTDAVGSADSLNQTAIMKAAAATCHEHEVDPFDTPGRVPVFGTWDNTDFCVDPYAALCGKWAAQTHVNRQNLIGPVREKIRRQALHDVAVEKGENPATFSIADIDEMTPTIKRIQFQAAYADRANHYCTLQTAALQRSEIDQVEAGARQNVEAGIRAQFPGDSTAQTIVRNGLLAKVRATRIVTSMDLATQQSLGDPYVGASYRKVCGPDGMADNAYNSTDAKGDPYVIICPGYLLAGQQTGISRDDTTRKLLAVLGHELGHSIDAVHVGNAPYKAYLSCLEDQHSGGLAYVGNGSGETSAHVTVQVHRGEITADFWAVRTAAEYMTNHKPALSLAEKASTLISGWSGLCGGDDSGDEGHPSGRFRIEVLLRRDPAIHELMKCAKNPGPSIGETGLKRIPKPGCTKNGQTSDDLF